MSEKPVSGIEIIDPNGSNIIHYMRRFVRRCEEQNIDPTPQMLLAAPMMYKTLKAAYGEMFTIDPTDTAAWRRIHATLKAALAAADGKE